jgi:hypothetical protein
MSTHSSKWDTCILFSLAEITTTKTLDCGRAKMHQNAPAAMLRLILDGFDASDFTKNRVRRFVREYKRATRDPEAPK